MFKIKEATKQGWIKLETPGIVDLLYPSSTTRRGRVQSNGKVCPTIQTTGGLFLVEGDTMKNIKIRKLTPHETFVLMGLTREDCDKCQALGISDTGLFRIAGNGLITNCVSLICEHLFKSQYDENYICHDEITN